MNKRKAIFLPNCIYILLSLLFLAVAFFLAQSTHAYNTQYNADRNTPFARTASDFSPNTGAVVITQTDLRLPGRGGLDLELTRIYTSSTANLYDMGYNQFNQNRTLRAYDISSQEGRPAHTHIMGKYRLGAGWRFAFPAMGINYYNNQERQINLFMPDGSVFSLFFTEDPDDSNLQYWPIKDMLIREDTSYEYQGIRSAYCLISKGQQRTYFDPYGNLLAICAKDGRRANRIRFLYEGVPDKSVPISKIQDTCDRTIQFTYDSQGLLEKVTYEGKEILYTHQMISDSSLNVPTEDKRFLLTSVCNPMGLLTRYTYQLQGGLFSFGEGTSTEINVFANLAEVHRNLISNQYASRTCYSYEQAQKLYLSPGGYMNYYRLTHRWDEAEDGGKYNEAHISYTGNPYYNPQYSTRITYPNGTIQEYLFAGAYPQETAHVCLSNKKQGTSGEVEIEAKDYDNRKCPILKEIYKGISQTKVSEHQYQYDIYGNLTWERDEEGGETFYTYHPVYLDQVIETRRYNEDLEGKNITFIQRRILDNATGDPLEEWMRAETDPNTYRITRNEYDPNFGTIIQRIDARGNTTHITYEALFNAYPEYVTQEVTDPDGVKQAITIHTTYDDYGRKVTLTNARGNTTRYTYDLLDRITKEIYADESQKSYTYNDIQSITETVDEEGLKTSVDQDGLGHTITQITYEQDGNTPYSKIHYAYDVLGNKTWEQGPNGQEIVYDYDGFNRLIKTIHAPATADQAEKRIEYRDAQLEKSIIDSNNHKTDYRYDRLDRLIEIKEHNKIQTYTTQYIYDNLGNRQKVIDAKARQKSYQYNDLKQLIQERYPDGTKRSYTYDRAGNIIERTDRRGLITTYTYDERNRLQKVQYGNQGQALYWYDENGNIKKVKNDTIEEGFEYDKRDRPIRKDSLLDGTIYTTQYQYDKVGNCTGIREPLQDDWQEYQFDHQHRLSAVLGYADFAYYKNGQIEKINYGNGLQTSYTLDHRNRPKTIFTTEGILELWYVYDGEGNVLEENEDIFTYDDLDRLQSAHMQLRGILQNNNETLENIRQSFGYYTQEANYDPDADLNHDRRVDGLDLLMFAPGYQGPGNKIAYTYDQVGNRTKREENSEEAIYEYDPNMDRLLRVTKNAEVIRYEYDLEGNMAKKITPQDTLQYTYDHESRLILVHSQTQGLIAEYFYNANGQRVKKLAGTATTLYHYNGEQVILEETREGVDHTLKRYLYAGNLHLAEEETQVRYYHCDHLGSTRVLSDATGNKVWWEDYYPFGSRLAGEGTGITHQFTGKEKDQETGLMYYGARYYDTQTGRFVSEDPAEADWEDSQSLNRYVYCRNNPLKYIDPTGELFIIDDILCWLIGSLFGTTNDSFFEGVKKNFFGSWNNLGEYIFDTDNIIDSVKKPLNSNFNQNMSNIEFINGIKETATESMINYLKGLAEYVYAPHYEPIKDMMENFFHKPFNQLLNRSNSQTGIDSMNGIVNTEKPKNFNFDFDFDIKFKSNLDNIKSFETIYETFRNSGEMSGKIRFKIDF